LHLAGFGWKSRVLVICSLLGGITLCQALDSQTAANKTDAARSHRSTAAKKKSLQRTKRTSRAKKRGQQKIETDRTRAIQKALIRSHYLNGEASGNWDSATQRAMERYQADNGWQNKTVPDSRALIKLGLGPNHDHLLNPESAMTSAPAAPAAAATPSHIPASTVDPAGSKTQPQP